MLTEDSRLVIEQQVNGEWQELASSNFDKGLNTLYFRPTSTDVRYRLAGPFYVKVGTECVTKQIMEQQSVLVDVCDEVKDRYRFGFNGQEKVNEWAGIGNFMDYKERGQDTRIARFMSVDGLAGNYPWYSPYQFAGNSPVKYIDRDGLEPAEPTDWLWKHKIGNPDFFEGGSASMYKVKATDIKTQKPRDFYIYTRQIDLSGTKYYWYSGIANENNGWEVFRNTISEDALRIQGSKDFCTGIAYAPTVVVGAGVMIIAGAQAGVGACAWNGLRWFGRNYGRALVNETAKEVLANRGDLSNFDVLDVALGTVTHKLGAFGKVVNGFGASYFDLTLRRGFESGVNGSKDNASIFLDGVTESFKVLGSELGAAGGFSDAGNDLVEVYIDQVKTEASEMIDKASDGNNQNKRDAEIEKGNLHPE